jgi:serine/threonine protein kinase
MDIQNNIIANKYHIDKFIGNGKFGKVYRGINNKNKNYVAIKLEDKRTSYKLLKRETSILKYLYEKKCRSIPSIYWFGEIDDFMGLIMSYYDCSLFEYLNIKSINQSKLNYIMVKSIQILESIHCNFVIHRDIKPQNFMIKNGELFLIDFGLATFWVNDEQIHISNSTRQEIIGTPKYISPNIHQGWTPSRRDDIISLGYIYIYLFAQELPWDSVYTDTENEIYNNEIHILHSKNIQRRTLKSLEHILPVCENINKDIDTFFQISYKIDFHETPPYNSLCSVFNF